MPRSPTDHAIEECAELIEILAKLQFALIRQESGWKEEVRDLREEAISEWQDVRKILKRAL